MTRWLLVTGARLAAILGLVVLCLWLAVWRPEQQARQLVARQLALSHEEISGIEKASTLLNSASPAGDAPAVAADLPNPVAGASTKLIRAVNRVVGLARARGTRNVPADLAEAKKLIAYQGAVSKALLNLEAYNAADDMAGFALGSDDSMTRVSRAKAGLTKTAGQLASARKLYDDSSLEGVTAAVSKLQTACSALAASVDAAKWAAEVQAAQAEVSQNRVQFWAVQSAAMKAKLQLDLEQARSVQSLWSQLAQSNGI